MTKALALAFAVSLAVPAFASEEEATQLKIYVDGMSCPTGCAPKVAKGLSAVQGAKDVKMADFDKGLFTMSLDGKSKLEVDAVKKSLGEYKVTKIEATISGTIGLKDKAVVLTTASGQKVAISLAGDCAEEKTVAKTDAAPKKDAAKKGDCDGCPVAAAALKAKVESLAKDGKNVKVSGTLGTCCELSIVVAAIDEVKKATN